jgi:hypothetical protein
VAVRFIAERSLRSLGGYGDLWYDFLADARHIETAQKQVLEKWMATGAMPAEQVLIDQSGALMQEQVDGLLRSRNDRPLTLVE